MSRCFVLTLTYLLIPDFLKAPHTELSMGHAQDTTAGMTVVTERVLSHAPVSFSPRTPLGFPCPVHHEDNPSTHLPPPEMTQVFLSFCLMHVPQPHQQHRNHPCFVLHQAPGPRAVPGTERVLPYLLKEPCMSRTAANSK